MLRACSGPAVKSLPDWFRDSCLPKNVPTLYKALPRLCGASPDRLTAYEESHLHADAKTIFALRNQFAHATENWDHRRTRGHNIIQFWGSALDLIVLLEEIGAFDIPRTRIQQFKAEIEKVRKLAPAKEEDVWRTDSLCRFRSDSRTAGAIGVF